MAREGEMLVKVQSRFELQADPSTADLQPYKQDGGDAGGYLAINAYDNERSAAQKFVAETEALAGRVALHLEINFARSLVAGLHAVSANTFRSKDI